jgi:hypothetical protein
MENENCEAQQRFKIIRPDGSIIFELGDLKLKWREMFVGNGWYWLEVDEIEVFLQKENGVAQCFAKINSNEKQFFFWAEALD